MFSRDQSGEFANSLYQVLYFQKNAHYACGIRVV